MALLLKSRREYLPANAKVQLPGRLC